MAGSSIVEVIIRAKDQASAVAKGAAAKIRGSFSGMEDQIGGMMGRAAANFHPAQAAMTAATAGAAVGVAAFGAAVKIAEGSTESLNMQLGAANNWSSLTGDSFAKSQKIVDDITSSLGDQAASLPGTTAAYSKMGNAILDNVVGAFTAVDGSINKSGSVDWIKENVANLEILRQASGATEGQSAKDISRFISGQYKSEKGLMVSDFFAMNPTLTTNLGKAAKELGYSTLEEMLKAGKKEELVKALGMASAKSVTKELKDALSHTYDGAKETMLTKLFDPNKGLFGGLRKFDLNGVSTNMNEVVAGVINRMTAAGERIGVQAGKLMEAMGFSSDPLVNLANFANWVADTTDGLADFTESLDMDGLAATAMQVSDAARVALEVGFKPLQLLGESIGNMAGGVAGALIKQRTEQSAPADASPMSLVGTGIKDTVGASVNAANNRIIQMGMDIRIWALGLVQKFQSFKLPQITLPTIPPLPPMPPLNVSGWLAPIRAGIANLGAQMLAAGSSFSAGVAAVAAQIMAAVQSMISGMMAGASVLAGYAGAVAGAISSGMAAVGSAILSAVQSLVGQAQAAANAALGSIGLPGVGGSGASPSGAGVASRASGQHVGAFNQAIAKEQRQMPTGAKPVIANSSEAIIPAKNLGAVAQMVASPARPQTLAGITGAAVNMAATINIYDARDSDATVSKVVAALETQYRRAKRAALA